MMNTNYTLLRRRVIESSIFPKKLKLYMRVCISFVFVNLTLRRELSKISETRYSHDIMIISVQTDCLAVLGPSIKSWMGFLVGLGQML